MTKNVTIGLDADMVERLRRVAEATGETVEALAAQALEGFVEEIELGLEGNWGDDAELQRRLAAWEATRESIPADEIHAWLKSLDTDHPLPPPKARRP